MSLLLYRLADERQRRLDRQTGSERGVDQEGLERFQLWNPDGVVYSLFPEKERRANLASFFIKNHNRGIELSTEGMWMLWLYVV